MKNNLVQYFPDHKMRIDLFFGAGGDYFYLPQPKYAILNDLDDDVTNLYLLLLNQKEELIKQIELMPISEGLLKYWRQHLETDPMKKALRFLLLSNFTYLGKGDTLRLGLDNTKKVLLRRIEPTFKMLQNAKITNQDFRDVIPKISFSDKLIKKNEALVYMDPVYLDTQHYYKVPTWKESDTEDCFRIMQDPELMCAMSEFDYPTVLAMAKDYKMNIYPLKERKNIKGRAQEIIMTNYPVVSTGQTLMKL